MRVHLALIFGASSLIACVMLTVTFGKVIAALGGEALFLAAVAWLIKTLVAHRLTREAEAFKVQLESRSAIEVERLKASLQLVATEHQIQFAKLHEKRALVIADLYPRLIETRRAAGEFILGDIQDEERSVKAQEAVWELYRFIELNRIYLPETVCTLADKFESKLRKSVIFANSYWTRIRHPTPRTEEDRNKVLIEACEVLESELPNVLKELQVEFRKLLGGSHAILQ